MTTNKPELPITTWLTCGALLLSAVSLPACEIGYKPIGGEEDADSGDGDGDGATTAGDGDGDTTGGDGDGEAGTTAGDGDGDGECPPPPVGFDPVGFDYTLTLGGQPIAAFPFDQACTVASVAEESMTIDCNGTSLELGMVAGQFMAKAGDGVHVWLHRSQDGLDSTWMRLDFTTTNYSVFVIDAPSLTPPDAYFPPPWGLEVVDSCGPVDDGCATIEQQQLRIDTPASSIALWAGDNDSIDYSQGTVYMAVGRAEKILGIAPNCDPAPEFYNTYRLQISSTTGPVEGNVCDPSEEINCATGLHCCSPCGVQGCDLVCMPEDPDTMECPPPAP